MVLDMPCLQSISGLVVEYIVAIDVTRVRFPADAYLMYMSSLPPSHLQTIVGDYMEASMLPGKNIYINEMTAVGFEPTPFRNGALSHRLRPLGQTVLSGPCKGMLL